MPRSFNVNRRSISPPFVDSPVSDDALPSFVFAPTPRFAKLPFSTGYPLFPAPGSSTLGSGSSPSPSSVRSNRITCTGDDSPDGYHRLPAVTPSPNEASSVPGSLATSHYFTRRSYSGSGLISPLHDPPIASPLRATAVPYIPAHGVPTNNRLSVSRHHILAPSPQFFPSRPVDALSPSGAAPFDGPSEGGVLSTHKMDGSWALPVALNAADPDSDDRDPLMSISGEDSSRSAHPGLLRELPSLSAGERPTTFAYTPGRSTVGVPPQDDPMSAIERSSLPSIGSRRPLDPSRPHHRAPLASSSAAISSSADEGAPEASRTYAFVPLPGNTVKKRPRRRHDEIERLYQCGYMLPSMSLFRK
jgi:hypothetical protein